ncbi:hypothetical protein yinte0001_6310 [Yersinia intermedia ATCC 29909]|nr:hypothetical protein yinte0001_6310 [Yersinia intermedia ATCC 29909]
MLPILNTVFLAQVFTAGKDKHKCKICGVYPEPQLPMKAVRRLGMRVVFTGR